MARVTGAEVLEIFDTTLLASELTPFITAANLIVTDVLADAEYSDALEKEIERWLSAHLAAIRDPRVKQESYGSGASQGFHGGSSEGLGHTPYGQQVLILDYKGYFAAIQNTRRRAELKALV